MISFIDEDPEDRRERAERERRHPHVVRLTDGEKDVAQQLVRYAKERHEDGTANMTAMEHIDLIGLEQALEES